MPEQPYLAFLRDPDQEAREAEFSRFVGRNQAAFLVAYRTFRADAVGQRPRFRLRGYGFCVPAFLLGPVWFLYRKMWLVAAIIFVLEVGLSFIPGTSRAGFPIAILCGVFARRTYVQAAVERLARARRPDGSLDEAMIARHGGVSRIAGWIGGILYGIAAIVLVASVVLLMRAGMPPPQ